MAVNRLTTEDDTLLITEDGDEQLVTEIWRGGRGKPPAKAPRKRHFSRTYEYWPEQFPHTKHYDAHIKGTADVEMVHAPVTRQEVSILVMEDLFKVPKNKKRVIEEIKPKKDSQLYGLFEDTKKKAEVPPQKKRYYHKTDIKENKSFSGNCRVEYFDFGKVLFEEEEYLLVEQLVFEGMEEPIITLSEDRETTRMRLDEKEVMKDILDLY